MKTSIVLITALLLMPVLSMAQSTIITPRVQATIKDGGNWELTDTLANVTWYGQWITPGLMKVTGTDNSCFVIGENDTGMVQLNCTNLRQISILLSYANAS